MILFVHLLALMFSVLHGTNSSVGYKWEHPTADLRYIEILVLFLIFKALFTVKVIQYIEIYVVNEYWIINLIQIKTNRCFIFTGFDLSIEHPHTNVVKTCQLVKGKHLFWNLIEISSVGKKTSRLSQNMVLDFCLLCKVKKDLYGAGKDTCITEIFTWLTYLKSFFCIET